MQLNMLTLTIYLLGPVFLFVACDAFADDNSRSDLDFVDDRRIPLFGALLLYLISQILVSWIIKNESLVHPQNLFRYSAFVLLVPALIVKRRRYHALAAAVINAA